jgi:hypothetical protein
MKNDDSGWRMEDGERSGQPAFCPRVAGSPPGMPPCVAIARNWQLRILGPLRLKNPVLGKRVQAQMFAFVSVCSHYFTIYVVGRWRRVLDVLPKSLWRHRSAGLRPAARPKARQPVKFWRPLTCRCRCGSQTRAPSFGQHAPLETHGNLRSGFVPACPSLSQAQVVDFQRRGVFVPRCKWLMSRVVPAQVVDFQGKQKICGVFTKAGRFNGVPRCAAKCRFGRLRVESCWLRVEKGSKPGVGREWAIKNAR